MSEGGVRLLHERQVDACSLDDRDVVSSSHRACHRHQHHVVDLLLVAQQRNMAHAAAVVCGCELATIG